MPWKSVFVTFSHPTSTFTPVGAFSLIVKSLRTFISSSMTWHKPLLTAGYKWRRMLAAARVDSGGDTELQLDSVAGCSQAAANTPPQDTSTLGQEQPDQTTGEKIKNWWFVIIEKIYFLSSKVEWNGDLVYISSVLLLCFWDYWNIVLHFQQWHNLTSEFWSYHSPTLI